MSPGVIDGDRLRKILADDYVLAAVNGLLEIGIGQADAVAELMTSWRVEIRPDLAGIPRVVCGWL